MPELTPWDAARMLPVLDQLARDLALFAAAGHHYLGHIEATSALRGEIHDALTANGRKIASACDRVRDVVSARVAGMRLVAEMGVSTAVGCAAHVGSIEFPGFI